MSLKRINHGNENHTPGFVEDTGDTMTGNLYFTPSGATALLKATAGKSMYFGANNVNFFYLRNADGGTNSVITIDRNNLFYPIQAPTVSAPTYYEGALYYDTTLHKLRVGGATGWETVTSS